jgi:3-isopropylmalate dehydratase small subunit
MTLKDDAAIVTGGNSGVGSREHADLALLLM